MFGGNFLAAGPLAGQPAILTFIALVNYLSFLWGSPDTYNIVTLVSSAQTYTFTAQFLGFPVTNGNQAISTYAQFVASAAMSSRVFAAAEAEPESRTSSAITAFRKSEVGS